VSGDAAVAARALALVDLTELGDAASADDVVRLCARADGPHGRVAAICTWPRFVALARRELEGTGVRVATVTGFPSGAEPVDHVVAQTVGALADGADEIDVVLPYRSVIEGDVAAARSLLDAVREVVPSGTSGHVLKVILETGELADPELVELAARTAIEAGADFVKTSTGKTRVSATLEATAVMLRVIRGSGRPVGLKPSGGIRTVNDAAAYLAQADAAMGPAWATPATFRFGASGLLDALEAALGGTPAAPPADGY